MVPSMVHQVLHHPQLAKLDLGSLITATSGAAHLPPELRTAFERKAKNVSFMQEGSYIYISFYLLHPSHELQQDMGCPKWCVVFLDAIHGANHEHPRRLQLSPFPFQECSEDV